MFTLKASQCRMTLSSARWTGRAVLVCVCLCVCVCVCAGSSAISLRLIKVPWLAPVCLLLWGPQRGEGGQTHISLHSATLPLSLSFSLLLLFLLSLSSPSLSLSSNSFSSPYLKQTHIFNSWLGSVL